MDGQVGDLDQRVLVTLVLAVLPLDADQPQALPGDALEVGPEVEGGRYLPAGLYDVCVEGLFGGEVPAYRLSVEIGDDSCVLPDIVPTFDEDLDGDGLADNCDDDQDGDGLTNANDNCPAVSNGPLSVPPTPNDSGYIGTWLILAPLTNVSAPYSCMPDYTEWLGNDAMATPEIGDVVDSLVWEARVERDDLMAFHDWYFGVSSPRQIYAVSYVYSATQRSVDLAVGHDDGARVWFNHQMIAEDGTCQGAQVDDYLYPVTLSAGWNTVQILVYDGGGNWGLYARFKDGTDPVTDLELSLVPDTAQVFDQSDQDGDGVGDVCDPSPVG